MNTKEGAAKILCHLESVYVPTHHYALVDARDFKHLDIAYYDKVQRYLESQGFRWVGDKEDVTFSNAPGGIFHRVLIRVLVSADGKISAGIYHPKMKAWWLRILLFFIGKRLGRIVDFETEFSDGTFICTSNAMAAGKITLPRQISCEFLHRDTKVEALLARHQSKLTGRSDAAGVSYRLVKSYADNVAMQNRMNALKAAYRGEIGGITKEELDNIAPQYPGLVADVYEEIGNIRNARR